jgi:ribosomal RNA-processing protein 36
MVQRRKTANAAATPPVFSKPAPKRSREEFEDEDSGDSSQGSVNEFEEGSSQDGLSYDEEFGSEEEFEEEDADPDAPRLVQWDDDDELDYEQTAKPEKAVKAKGSDLVRL